MSEEKELPKGWIYVTISELISNDGVFVDGDWIESKDQDPNGDVRLIQLADIGDGEFRNKSNRFLTKVRAKELNCTFLKEGDILVARMPDPIGRACIFPLKGDEKFITAVDVAIIRLGHNSIENKFLVHSINNRKIRNEIENLQSGTTRKRISRANLATIKFPLPPLPEQHRIVAKIEELFSSLDKGIESLKTAQQQLKVYRQAVLKHAFEGKLTVKWRQQQEMGARLPAGRFEGRFTNKDIKEGKLPEGWVWKTIEDVCNMKAGFFVKASDIKENFEDGLFPCYGGNGLRGYVKSITHDGTFVLVGRQGALCGNVHLVKGKFHATEHALVTKAKENVDIQWLYYKLISMKLNQYSSGVAQPGLSVNKLLPIELSVPTLPEQHHIVSEIEKRLSVADKLEESIATALQQAEALRQSILKKAFEGRLLSEAELNECRKDPNWEPASVLLERIKKERETQTNSVKKKSVKTKKSTKSKNLNQSKNE